MKRRSNILFPIFEKRRMGNTFHTQISNCFSTSLIYYVTVANDPLPSRTIKMTDPVDSNHSVEILKGYFECAAGRIQNIRIGSRGQAYITFNVAEDVTR